MIQQSQYKHVVRAVGEITTTNHLLCLALSLWQTWNTVVCLVEQQDKADILIQFCCNGDEWGGTGGAGGGGGEGVAASVVCVHLCPWSGRCSEAASSMCCHRPADTTRDWSVITTTGDTFHPSHHRHHHRHHPTKLRCSHLTMHCVPNSW